MNFKTVASASLFAVLSFGAIAAQATTAPMGAAGAMQYRYGEGISEQAFSYARIPATPDPSRP